MVKSREHLKTLAKQVEDALSCQRKVGGRGKSAGLNKLSIRFLQDFHLIMLEKPLEKQGWNLGSLASDSTPIPTDFL